MEVSAPRSLRAPRSIFSFVVLLVVVATIFLVAYPLATMIVRAFVVDDTLTFAAISSVLAEPSLPTVLANTALMVVLGGTIALLIGATFAWFNERTDAGFGWMGEILPLIPLLVPILAGVIGWVFLLAPQAGFVNVVLRQILSALNVPVTTGPINIYTMPGLIFTTALYLVPYVYLVVSAALRNIDPALEEASRVSGAGPRRTLVRVTLPAVAPALGGAVMLTVIMGIALFSVPIVIGTAARIDVLSVRIFRLLYSSFPPRTAEALTLSLFMLALVQGALLLQSLVVRRGHYATIGGRGVRRATIRLGRWRRVAQGIVGLYVAGTTVLPIAGLVLVSLQSFWSPNVAWANLDLSNYAKVLFENRLTSRALVNSATLAVSGATIGMLLAALLTIFVQRGDGLSGRLVDVVTSLPAAVPHTVIGVGFLLALGGQPFNLQGTALLLLLAYLVMYLPQAARSSSSAAAQVGRELSEASRVFGASSGRTFFRIVLPLMLPGLLAGWIMLFVLILGELTASALLAGTSTPVVGLVMLDLWESGTFPQIAALAVLLTGLDILVIASVFRLIGSRFDPRGA